VQYLLELMLEERLYIIKINLICAHLSSVYNDEKKFTISMNSTQPSVALQDQTKNKINPAQLDQANLIEVVLNDLEAEHSRVKGICVVLPASNNGVVIGSVVLRTKLYADHVIVVDDASHDCTAEVARLAGAEVIHLKYAMGKTYALLLGLRYVQERNYSAAVIFDPDCTYDPKEIPRLGGIILAGKADLVIGSQFLEKNGNIPIKQRIKQMMLDLPAGTPPDIIPTDPLSGFMAFSRNGLENLDFPFERTRFNQNLIKHFLSKNLSIQEVAVSAKLKTSMKYRWDNSATIIAALPAYNEETYLAKIIPQIKPSVDFVIVVDDGSTDATSTISHHMGAYVIKHPENRGYGGALQTIFSAAREFNADALVIMDSDGQHDPNDVEKVLEPLLDGAEVVIGSRFLDTTKNVIPKYRKIGMKVLDTATSAAGVENGLDTQSGFRAYGKKAISIINISGTGMSAGSEILVQIKDNNLRIAEVPIHVRYDIKGTSSQNPVTHGFLALYNIIGMISYRRPLPIFGIPGIIFVIAGLLLGSWAITEYYTSATFPFVLLMVSMVLVMLGLSLIIASLILNYLVVFVTDMKTQRFSK
jgi:glycosyltransferase involved in cell wall biosynthesis